MIKKDSFDITWIRSFNDTPYRADPYIIQKEIYALKLLELLAQTNLEFVFKGGTCLSLMFQEFTRFSVDIDITTNANPDLINSCIEQINLADTFIRYEEQHRPLQGNLIKKHYKFYYNDLNNNESAVLLDIVFEENCYDDLRYTTIDFRLLQTEEPYITVQTPSLQNMLFDKLTAFAPDTIGITYDSLKYMEIIKQMYDVSKIVKQVSENDFNRSLYDVVANKQIEYRSLRVNTQETLKDSIFTGLNILSTGFYNSKKYELLARAIDGFSGYVYGNRFSHIDAEDAAIDVIYVATILLAGSFELFIEMETRFTGVIRLEALRSNYRRLRGNHLRTQQFARLEKCIKVLLSMQIIN